MIWRIMPFTTNSASINMAIDSSIIETVAKRDSPPTLRLYRWKPSAVSIGYFQSINEEVNLDACKRKGIEVVRRITGGGAVYHDYFGEITYSIIIPENTNNVPKDIIKSYELICGGIIYALNRLGLKAEFKPINDITVNDKKISGNAQTRRKGVILQHGTILTNLNIKEMFSVLNISKEKISDKMIKSVQERVTSINNELSEKVNFYNIYRLLIEGFSKKLEFEFEIKDLTEKEEKLVTEFNKNQFSNENWIFKR